MQLHICAIGTLWKFHVVSNMLQVCGNPECHAECGIQFCDIFQHSILTHVQSIDNQHPTGKQGVELHVGSGALYGGCPEWHPCLPELL